MVAVPKPQPQDWLAAAADELRLSDRATLTLLQESSKNVNKILRGLPDTPEAAFGDLVYRAQLERTRQALLDEQAKLFDRLNDKVSARRLRSASRAAKLSAASDAALLRLVGEGKEGETLYAGAKVTAQRTVDTILKRANLSAVPLSERIYKTQVWMHKRLDTLIGSTMAAGLNAQKFAKVARDWFSPSVPGGTRYAAMRLARTEINNAFHATSIAYAQDKPWVDKMDWHLSKSHPTPDGCNVIAAASPYDVREIPRKPHPQCMCYVTEATPDEDEWIDRFVNGEFDDYLNSELAKADAALGIKQAVTGTGTSVRVQKAAPARKPINPNAQAILDQLQIGTKIEVIGRPDLGGEVAKIGDKSVWFKDGTYEHIRGLGTYRVVSQPGQEALAELTGEDALAAVAKGLHKRGSLTAPQRKAFKEWESSWFMVINSFLRDRRDDNGSSVDRGLLATTGHMDSAFAASVISQKLMTWRGMYRARRLFGDNLDHDLTGFSWDELGYTSTTYVERMVNDFMLLDADEDDNVKLIVHIDEGIGAVEVSTAESGSKDNGGQAEIALQRGLKWRVIADHGKDPKKGFRVLEVQVSQPPTQPPTG